MRHKVLWILPAIVIGALVFVKWRWAIVWKGFSLPVLLYSRALPANHQLSISDVDFNRQDTNRISVHDSLSSFIGRHLVQAKKVGEAIQAGDLARAPVVQAPGRDSSIFLLTVGALEQPLLQLLDADEVIQVADTPHPFQPGCLQLRVVAVHRPTAELPGSWLLVEGPTAKAVESQFRISSATRMILLVNQADSEVIAGCPTTTTRSK
jgi:hypothetical protein